MILEWDPQKARWNLRKHHVSFEEAATALSDPVAATGSDPDHSIAESRYITFGTFGTWQASGRGSHGTGRHDSDHKRSGGEQERTENV
jgi:uncharacterized DUF497 family protein